MSIPILEQVSSEVRRLMIAGSLVAHGDFRLKKLLPPLQGAGAKVPVLAKISELANAVVEGPEETAAGSLLELSSLINAVRYTQGEIGLDGAMTEIETTDLGLDTTTTSARVLKSLIEALTTTGSGRLETISHAIESGLFRDLRLVKPALAGLDDPYPEIAELLAEKVLPRYGKAILPLLRSSYDPKGTKGHPRRLKLMHAIDPSGSRDLVKAALENGSKEVKIAAISCLGAEPEDLNFLLEQAVAKSQDVRAAAYEALAQLDAPEAIEALQKGLATKDHRYATLAIQHGKSGKHLSMLLAEIRLGLEQLGKLKEKKAISEKINRLTEMLRAFPKIKHREAEDFVLDLFSRRGDWEKLKGELASGADLIEAIIEVMASWSDRLKTTLAEAHSELSGDALQLAFEAARDVYPPERVFEVFSPYLTARGDEKKKSKDSTAGRRHAIVNSLKEEYHSYYWRLDDPEELRQKPIDPRWLDLAVAVKDSQLVQGLARPGHAAAAAFAKEEFDAALKKAKSPDDARDALITLLRLQHPDATDAFFSLLAKRNKKSGFYHYWYTSLAHWLPKSALPRLEEFVGTLPDNEANQWLNTLEKLRTRP